MKETASIWSALLLATVMLSLTSLHEVFGQSAIESKHSLKSVSSANIVLEVINTHFTRGRQIPSVYLRVFSDRTAECHTLKFTGEEADIVKNKILAPDEFERLQSLLDPPELLSVGKKYPLTRSVIDSWMEWDIKIQHTERVQQIQVASFSPALAVYPDVLVKLGCSILKIRKDVYSGDDGAYVDVNCKTAPEKH